MLELLRSPENENMSRSGIRTAVEKNYIYNGFRWKYADEENEIANLDPTKEKVAKRETIVKLNELQTEILDTYSSIQKAAESNNLSRPTMRKYIQNNIEYDNCYFIELKKCPTDIVKNYNGKINKYTGPNSKKVKQINNQTKKCIIFNSLTEVYLKLGITQQTILNAINNKSVCNGCLWMFCEK